MRTTLVFVFLFCTACATSSKRDDDAERVPEADAFIERTIALGAARDVAVADHYVDDAHVRFVRYWPDGRVTRTVLTGVQLKALYPKLLEQSDPSDKSEYQCTSRALPDVGAPRAGLVDVRCMRYSHMRDYWAPASFLVGRDDSGVWRIYGDVLWTCEDPSSCTKDMPWAAMRCAEGKSWREPVEKLDVHRCEGPRDLDHARD